MNQTVDQTTKDLTYYRHKDIGRLLDLSNKSVNNYHNLLQSISEYVEAFPLTNGEYDVRAPLDTYQACCFCLLRYIYWYGYNRRHVLPYIDAHKNDRTKKNLFSKAFWVEMGRPSPSELNLSLQTDVVNKKYLVSFYQFLDKDSHQDSN